MLKGKTYDTLLKDFKHIIQLLSVNKSNKYLMEIYRAATLDLKRIERERNFKGLKYVLKGYKKLIRDYINS